MQGSIVVAIDGSESSQDALHHAVELARHGHSGLTGVFVIDGGWADFIGNDWQSSKGSRQGFLDYIRREQEQQAEKARRQFEVAAGSLPRAAFHVEVGDPESVVLRLAREPSAVMLVLSRRVFQINGRPSLKRLADRLVRKATQPIVLFP